MESQMTSFISSTSVSTSSAPQWYNSTPLLLEKLPPQVHSTPRNPSSCSSVPSRSRDSGLGSLASDSTTFSFTSTFCPPLSPNAIAFSIENLLGLSTPKQESSSTKQERALQPLNLSTSALPRPRTYSCRYCSKAYSSRSSMRLHEATHTMPFQCPECGRRFSRLWLLESHRRTHTGERPFACSVCARRFADRSNMRAHKRTHRCQ